MSCLDFDCDAHISSPFIFLLFCTVLVLFSTLVSLPTGLQHAVLEISNFLQLGLFGHLTIHMKLLNIRNAGFWTKLLFEFHNYHRMYI